jgi:ubiquinone biosynthesis protein
LLFDFLQHSTRVPCKETQALLAEQKKTNRLLSAILYGGVGFVLGLVAMQLLVRVRLF